ncbi:hypothetical protein BLA24_17145 [Streptomyces cinnamoneus]|uniref:Uncharacterized protein n=1 Tax=Streptomyces cinnamoneus TaxID=53446 RepID=A0A2G1XH31_STRCJ|nr:hypothetical protein [Streptomyces cinnamoneus]PHQ50543.1 hypothetical protein BLA24_17145 [Streptomyces cinnamoneus]PPT14203.1 hypothetical protein CYQ11_16130 [Streptomyces cinnamoneus]
MPVFPGTAMPGPAPRLTLQQRLRASVKPLVDPPEDSPGAAFVAAHGDPATWSGETCDAYLDLVHAEGLR